LKAKVHWLPVEDGGKKRLPIGKYSTAAHFLDDEAGQGWSVILQIESDEGNYVTVCDFGLLFPDRVPKALIYVGSKFELFEARKVAEGAIVELY
jgi:hypothetical protein